jgi:formate hydrogenlyase subunit 3/multisubunit Na+/H+ antiporter MnhD subunit
MSVGVVLGCVLALIVAACAAAAAGRHRVARFAIYGACTIACGIALIAALVILSSGQSSNAVLPVGLPWLGAHFRIDPLAAFFLAVVNLGGVAASIFALGYGRHEQAPQRVLPFVPAFLAGMNLVVMAADAFAFLVSWEFMSVVSWALVVSHDRSAENLRAGYIYILMASFGTLMLLAAFALLAGPGGSFAFADMQHPLPQWKAIAVVLLVLVGAGSKAGVVPLHVWLPLAHPAAPSHVSALMSGVMTKVAVYAFVRVAFDLLGPLDWQLSAVVIVLGGATALLGVLYALMEHDLKRLLAYHTVENIGIIFVGLGFALAFRANGLAAAAGLAVTAALFHVFNHSTFKSLLFFGAGAVHAATGERDMERLGGLIRTMPRTALAFLIGAAAISALPPLNGFASEWLTFQAIFLSPALPQWGLRFAAPAVGAMLALAAALAGACFVKAFGMTFLGRARSEAAETARETDRMSLAAMFALVALCVIAGAVPGAFTGLLASVSDMLVQEHVPVQAPEALWTAIRPTADSHSSYGGLVVLAAVAAAVAAIAVAIRIFAAGGGRRTPAWDCGFPDAGAATQYTAGSFAQPIRRVFGTVAFQATETVEMPRPGDTAPARFMVALRDPAWDYLFLPVVRTVAFVAGKANNIQYLTIRRYLSFVFMTLVLLLTVLALWL